MSLKTKQVAIVDSSPLIRMGLRSLIESDASLGVGVEATCPRDAIELITIDPPDLIVCEAIFPEHEGVFELLHDLHARIGPIPLLVISRRDEQLLATRVLQAGGQGYIMKSSEPAEMLKAIHRVLDGKTYLSAEMTDRAIDQLASHHKPFRQATGVEDLTNRELEVLDLVGEGMPSKSIASTLGISLKTVESHRANIRAKLGIDHSAGLIRYASQWRNLEGHHA